MCELSSKVSDAIEMFSGALVVGNHDSVTLFGIHPQNNLKDYSRRVTALLLKETEDLDMAISDVLAEIEHFELKAKSPIKSLLGKQLRHKEVLREYTRILSYIDSMILYFKLQQAQLIKEIKLLEQLSGTVSSCSGELEQYIEIGKRVLRERPPCSKNGGGSSSFSNTDSDEEVWYNRLEKRIDDLSVSHTVSLQSQAQIKMLHDNNLLMLDRIASAISNTFPIWQNQMATMLGVELLESRLNVQDKIVNTSGRYVEQTSAKLRCKRVHRKDSAVNVDKILELNHVLSKALIEMAQLEENYDMLCKTFLDVAHHTERG